MMNRKYISLVKECLSGDFEYRDNDLDHLIFGEIAPVNILVGSNNSRKSRFMRMLLSNDKLPVINEQSRAIYVKAMTAFEEILKKINSETVLSINERDERFILEAQGEDYQKYLRRKNMNSRQRKKDDPVTFFRITLRRDSNQLIFDRETTLNLRNSFLGLFTNSEEIMERNNGLYPTGVRSCLNTLSGQFEAPKSSKASTVNSTLLNSIKAELSQLSECFDYTFENNINASSSPKIYIPVLRGSIPLSDTGSKTAPCETTTLNLYFRPPKGLGQEVSLETGEKLYDSILESRNSTTVNLDMFSNFQNFVSTSFFQGRRVGIVPELNSDEKTIRIYIDGEKERELKDIGDGIQHLLILLYPIFMAEENSWVFIDEPELSLHPGFQNLFLETILNNEGLKKKNLRYFLTTHSNHFLTHALREPENVSVFSFSQYDEKQSTIRCVHGTDTNVLDQLGVENASVYMANCSIWVEGISDRKYIQAFLKAYCAANDLPEFQEGLDYTFFEYAGSNIRHYLFDQDTLDPQMIDSFKNANRIFLLADQDSLSQEKQQRHKELEAQAEGTDNFAYCTTKVLEIENLLPPEIYNDFVKTRKEQKEATFEAKREDYAQKPMGTFLQENTGDNPPDYGDGTLKTYYKNELSQFVLDQGYDWKDLGEKSEELKRITTAVYKFIEKHNPPRN